METTLTSRHFKAGIELHDFAIATADSFGKYHDHILTTEVVLTNEKSKMVEFNVHVKGHTVVASDESDDFMKSVAHAGEKIIRQLQKLKSK